MTMSNGRYSDGLQRANICQDVNNDGIWRQDNAYHIARWLESDIGDEEDDQSGRIFIAGEVEVLFHACNLCIADVGAVLFSLAAELA